MHSTTTMNNPSNTVILRELAGSHTSFSTAVIGWTIPVFTRRFRSVIFAASSLCIIHTLLETCYDPLSWLAVIRPNFWQVWTGSAAFPVRSATTDSELSLSLSTDSDSESWRNALLHTFLLIFLQKVAEIFTCNLMPVFGIWWFVRNFFTAICLADRG